jgi:hypothetical protein
MVYSRKTKRDIEGLDGVLRKHGYRLVHFHEPSNFLYVLSSVAEIR